ncbi:cysteine hydrolase family protein [Aestuariimicrobium kwangyangense]|uniref:cysteine hydrolase family protein n=1 Tax=Aestuariimicrobium kwangyangense TaxID=396389 RepID=UPI0003B491DB|nr:isochorismatase family protein [Aestuariimicrobium kwangyangense]
MSSRPWLLVIDPQRIFADPASQWCAPDFASIVGPVDALVAEHGERTIVTRWLPGDNRRGSWAAYFEKWSFADRPNEDAMFDLVDPALPWAAERGGVTLDVSTFGKFGASLLAITGPEPHLVLSGVATDCCVISTALAAADAGATVEVVGAACAGSSAENQAAALQVMGLYSPQITVR